MSLVCVDEHRFLADIEKLLKRSLPRVQIAGWEPDLTIRPERIPTGGQRGQRYDDGLGESTAPPQHRGGRTGQPVRTSQGARTRALAEFKDASLQVLVATDIAARGLDIVDLPHVVNFELPNVPEDYVHRIGRTGRAGASGIAVSFANHAERGTIRTIERFTCLLYTSPSPRD